MTPKEAEELVDIVMSCCPQQRFGPATSRVWFLILADQDFEACCDAVVAIKRLKPFVDPHDIIAEVKRARAYQLDHVPVAELQHGPHHRSVQAMIAAFANGHSVRAALAAPGGVTGRDLFGSVRARLGPSLEVQRLSLPELAAKQAAESRENPPAVLESEAP